jgi:site-specific recombinase XerD
VARLDRVDSRKRLELRREPHWHRLAEGRHLGYRRMTAESPGSWMARAKLGDKYRQHPLGDFAELDPGQKFDRAKAAAEQWFAHLDLGGSTEHLTVKQACERYVERLRTERSDAAADDAAGILKRFVDEDPIAGIDLAKLAPRNVADWRARLLKGGRSKAYVNRIMTALRAALNLAHDRRDAASDHAWRTELKALDAPSGRRTLYLDREQRRGLIDAASEELRPLVKALCLLPLRVGELAACRVADFDSRHGVLRVAGKTGQRDVPLSKDAIAFFRECAKSKLPTAWLVSRADGRQWDRFTWRDEVKLAAASAHLPPATTLYTLRHSTITDLVTDGLDLFTTAQVSGTSVAMIEQHYGKLRSQIAREALDKLAL